MAEKGRGRKVRFQGGSVFPIALASVTVLGLLLIWYSRTSVSSAAPGPRASDRDHWHVAYGFYACSPDSAASDYLGDLSGDAETSSKYLATGVHSHDDGVIHWHPTSAKASGGNAKLGVFLDNYDVELTDDKLTFPPEQFGGAVYEEGVTKCQDDQGKQIDGVLKAFVWPDADKPNDFRVLAAGLNDVRITTDGMAITIAFVPDDVTSIPEPPTAAKLAELGAADGSSEGDHSPFDSTEPTLPTGDSSPPATEAQTATTVAESPTTAAESPTTNS